MIQSVLNDSTFIFSLRWMLAMLFFGALLHKLSSPTAFVATLRDYQLLPQSIVPAVAYSVIGLEGMIALALVADSSSGSIAAAILLSVYTLAIFINVIRDRRDIECGCAGQHARQSVSFWLVGRNSILIVMALVTAMFGAEHRPTGLLDWFTATAAAAVFALVYNAANCLASNSGRNSHY